MNEQQLQTYIAGALADYEGPLLRYACHLCRDPETAKDAVQDTFVKLWQAGAKQPPEKLAAWLFKVCRNRVFEIMRKDKHMVTMDPTEVPATETAASPQQTMAETEKTQAVTALLGRLPPRQQELVRLKFQNGLSYQEISEVTGLSVSNVGVILHQAMTGLRQRAAVQGL